MTSAMMFEPPHVLDSNGGDKVKNFPIKISIYSSKANKSELYQLRYRAFRDSGWIPENETGEFADRYDTLESTFTVGASHDGQCIGTLRLAFGGAGLPPGTMPCEEQFPEEVRKLDAHGPIRMTEFSRMAVDPAMTNTSFKTTLYATLVRAGFMLTAAASTNFALIAVHKKTSRFYQSMCGFKVLSESGSYAGIAEPTHFLGLEVRALDERRQSRKGFFAFTAEELVGARQTLAAAQLRPVV